MIVPIYNKAKFIGRCVQSIKCQTVQDFEAILIDDGSTDGSLAETRSAVGTDRRFIVVTQNNGGVSRARNAAARAASGSHLVFLDADDEWLPGHLARLRMMAEAHPEAGLLASGYEIRGSQGLTFTTAHHVQEGRFDYCATWEALGETPISASSVAVRRDALAEVGFFPEDISLGEDILTWLKLTSRYDAQFGSEVTARVHQDDLQSLTRQPSARSVAGHAWFIDQLDQLRREGACSDYLIRRYALIHCYLLIRTQQKAELLKFASSHIRDLDVRTLSVAILEILGAGRPLRRLLGRLD